MFAIQSLGSVPTSFPNKKAGAAVGCKEILRIEDTSLRSSVFEANRVEGKDGRGFLCYLEADR